MKVVDHELVRMTPSGRSVAQPQQMREELRHACSKYSNGRAVLTPNPRKKRIKVVIEANNVPDGQHLARRVVRLIDHHCN